MFFPALLLSATPAAAMCDVIPSAKTQFRGALASAGRPFAMPGDSVTLTLDPTCHARSPGFTAESYVVTLVFTPPDGPHNVVVLSANSDTLESALAVCRVKPGVGSARAIEVPSVVLSGVDGRLSFPFPDTDALLASCAGGGDEGQACTTDAQCGGGGTCCVPGSGCDAGQGDDLTLTGPVKIAVTRPSDALPCGLASDSCSALSLKREMVACVDEIFTSTGGCSPQPDEVFAHFTALPPPNDFRALCTGPEPCTGLQDEIRAAVDSAGNLLIPMDYRGVKVKTELPVTSLLRGSASVLAFPDPSLGLLTIRDQATLASYNPDGIRLPPIFEPQLAEESHPEAGTTLFGTADSPVGVLRIAHRHGTCVGGEKDDRFCTVDLDCGGGDCVDSCRENANVFCDAAASCQSPCGQLFDFQTRMASGMGPVIIRDVKDVQALDPVPLDGLIQSELLNAFVMEEAITNEDFNGDGDCTDHVITLGDRKTGDIHSIGEATPGTSPKPGCRSGAVPDGQDARTRGRAIARVNQSPFSYPAAAADGGLLAFLEPEPLQFDQDANGNHSSFETILRVFRIDGGEQSALGPAIAVDAAPLINGRSLVISKGRVFFRTPENAAVPLRVTRVSEFPGKQKYRVDLDLSDDGCLVTFASNPLGPSSTNLRVYLKDRCGARGLEEVGARRDSWSPRISGNGRFLIYVSESDRIVPGDDNGVADVFLYDADTGARERISVSSPGEQPALPASSPSISDDGRFVAFASPLAWPDGGKVFVRDRCMSNGEIVPECAPGSERVSVGEVPNPFDAYSWGSATSADGRFVAFRSAERLTTDDPPGLDIYVRDRVAQSTERVLRAKPAPDDFGAIADISYAPSLAISSDGRLVMFDSWSNVVAGDTNGAIDVFVYDRESQTLERVSLDSDGGQRESGSDAALSGSGRYLAFVTDGSTRTLLSLHDRVTGMSRDIRWEDCLDSPLSLGRGSSSSLSEDGSVLAVQVQAEDGGHICVAAPELDAGVDAALFPDGALDDVVLETIDESGIRNTLCPAGIVAVVDGRAAFLRPEAAPPKPPEKDTPECRKGSLNGDGDESDQVVQFWPGLGPVENLGLAATSLAFSGSSIAAIGAEDELVWIRSVAEAGSSWVSTGQAATMVGMTGSLVAMLTRPDQGAKRLQIVDARSPGQLLLPNPPTAKEFVLGAADAKPDHEIIAFRTNDDMLMVYDGASRSLLPTGESVTPCPFEACDPRFPYRVLGDTVRFLTYQGGTTLVVKVFNVAQARQSGAEAALQVLAAAPAGVCTTTGDPCVDDGSCRAGGTCFVPPGTCFQDVGDCVLPKGPDEPNPCGEGAFCRPQGDEGAGVCRKPLKLCRGSAASIDGKECSSDDECLPGRCTPACSKDSDCGSDPGVAGLSAVCEESGQTFQRLVDPLMVDQAGTGAAVLVGTGRCIETLDGRACAASEDCTEEGKQGLFCDDGVCRRDAGTCQADGACPTGSVCIPELVAQTTIDSDSDGLPDVIDNCPRAANIEQTDLDGDGHGDACDVPNELCPGGAAMTGIKLSISEGDDSGGGDSIMLLGRIVVPRGQADAFDPAIAVSRGLQIAIEDLGLGAPAPLLDLSHRTHSIPPGLDGTGCNPADGWRASHNQRYTYHNASDALGDACVPGSAKGLRYLSLVDRRTSDGTIRLRMRVQRTTLPTPVGPLRLTLVLGADEASGLSVACATSDVATADCARRSRAQRLVCEPR